MSKMKDRWGDTIEVQTEDNHVYISFTKARLYDATVVVDMELDADMARKFVKKLKKAIAEMEDA